MIYLYNNCNNNNSNVEYNIDVRRKSTTSSNEILYVHETQRAALLLLHEAAAS